MFSQFETVFSVFLDPDIHLLAQNCLNTLDINAKSKS